MDLQACLRRIHYSGPLSPDYETLRQLQQAFLLSVPFENLDIHWGRRIEIASESVFDKVVSQGRGGFCYELNGLFHDLLTGLGFEVQFLAARMVKEGQPGREMGHMVLRVDLAGEGWLVDVGNGKSVRSPLRLDGAHAAQAEDFSYRVVQTASGGFAVLEKPGDAEWRTRFIFDLQPYDRSDFEDACHWTQTAPESIFTRNRICTLARPDGRVTLMNSTLTWSGVGRVQESQVEADELASCLQTHFGIRL